MLHLYMPCIFHCILFMIMEVGNVANELEMRLSKGKMYFFPPFGICLWKAEVESRKEGKWEKDKAKVGFPHPKPDAEGRIQKAKMSKT